MRSKIAKKVMHLLALPAFVSTMLLAAPAAEAALLCTQSVASLPVLDPNATSAALGDLSLDCNGGAASDPAVTANLSVFFNTSLLQDVAPTLTDGTNTYTGSFLGANQATFLGIPITPLATALTFQPFFVDPSLLAANFPITEFLSIFGATPIPLANSTLLVAINGEAAGGTVPEPGTLLLLAAAGAALFMIRRRRWASGAAPLPQA